MADQSVSVSNIPDPGSKQRVALELMRTIAYHEEAPSKDRVRAYYLDLFTECRKRVY